jgi:hypothetical protein
MFSERMAGCGLRCPRPVAYQPPRKGVGITHARRHPWIVPLSYVAVWRAPRAPGRPPKPFRACDASSTRPGPATTCATGSQATRLRRLPSAASWPKCSSRAVTPMSLHRNAEGRPPGGSRPKNAPASANESPSTEPSHALSVTRDDGKRRSRRGRWPLASASLYEPSCERTWWWISLRCPWCGSVHLHRVRHEEDAAGVRRTGCGRRVYVKIRTVYRSNASSGAAA